MSDLKVRPPVPRQRLEKSRRGETGRLNIGDSARVHLRRKRYGATVSVNVCEWVGALAPLAVTVSV
jgi:hypothetical protein